jgi:head-tail adaptor
MLGNNVMPRGPKTILTLQRRVTTQSATGGQTTDWRNMQTLCGVLTPKAVNEVVVDDKQTTIVDHELRVDFGMIDRELHADINEKNRFVVTGGAYDGTFKIIGIQNFHNRFYLIKLFRDTAIA